MTGDRARLPFVVLHLTLGLVVLYGSVRTALGGLHAGPSGGGNWHLVFLGTLAIAIVAHAFQREFPGNLLVYSAATWLVMVHGGLWHRTPAPASGVP
jgi:hypothetical protein